MLINNNYNKEKENWTLEDTLNFIEKCLLPYETINIKDKDKLICYEVEYDTLDFNEVPYLLRNEFVIPEYINCEIKKLEILIKQLYVNEQIKGNPKKNGIYFLLEYNNKIYSINYKNRIMTFSKIQKNINYNFEDLEIIRFEDLENYIDENKKNLIMI